MADFFVELFFLAIALAVLAKSAEAMVDKSLYLTKALGISELAAGFILLSVATSLPELSISIIGAIEGLQTQSVSVGNVLGASILDMTLVLGISALLGKISISRKEKTRILVFLSGSIMLVFLLASGKMSSFAGPVLISIFAAYCYYIYKNKDEVSPEKLDAPKKNVAKAFGVFLFATAILVASAGFAVNQAVQLASLAGVSNAFIGATLVSLGTTLPELSVSIMALRKGKSGLVLGNAFGSAVVNLTLVLGAGALVSMKALDFTPFWHLSLFFIAASIFLAAMVFKSQVLGRKDGFALLGVCALFLLWAFAGETA